VSIILILGLKLALVPLLVGGVTLAGRRWGPVLAGWLAAFPVVAGPILLFIAIEHGPVFAAGSAVGTLSAVLAILVFGISYAWAATRFSWAVSLAAGFSVYFLAVLLIGDWAPSLWTAAIAVFAATVIAPTLFPRVTTASTSLAPNDIHLRMIAGGILVILVTGFSARLGPQLSGVFAMFPVMASVLAAFSHRRSGAGFAINLLRGMALGYYAFAVFCVVLAILLPRSHVGLAFLASLASAALVQATSLKFLRRMQ
jgi:hypothetical protein